MNYIFHVYNSFIQKNLYKSFSIAIYFFYTLTATRATCATHHASSGTDIADTLQTVQAARPRFNATTKANAAIFVTFRTIFVAFHATAFCF